MAVDSRDKRGSVLGLGLTSLLVLPAPGTIDQPDRQHVAYSYRGITAQAALAASPDVTIQILAEPWIITVDPEPTIVQVTAEPWIITEE